MGGIKRREVTDDELQDLKALVRCDPELGKLFWINDNGRGPCRVKAGDQIKGCVSRTGYLRSQINGRHYLHHRLIWLLTNGEWPEQIDHINHDRVDNRIVNLRSVTAAENRKNQRLHARNKSGVVGVDWFTRDSKWRVQISSGGKNRWLGCYSDFDEACRVRREAEVEFGFHENHGAKYEKTSA